MSRDRRRHRVRRHRRGVGLGQVVAGPGRGRPGVAPRRTATWRWSTRAPRPTAAGRRCDRGSVLVVDQLEELFVLCDDPAARARFAAGVCRWAATAPVVVTLRADHLGEVTELPELAARVQAGIYLLGAMGEPQLRAAIEGPAAKAGLRLEPGLVDLLVRDVAGEPGALPLLSHALAETYERREGPVLTTAGYRAVGGVQGAVARAADEVVDSLPPEGRKAARDLFLRLVIPTETSDPIRQRVPRADLAVDPTTAGGARRPGRQPAGDRRPGHRRGRPRSRLPGLAPPTSVARRGPRRPAAASPPRPGVTGVGAVRARSQRAVPRAPPGRRPRLDQTRRHRPQRVGAGVPRRQRRPPRRRATRRLADASAASAPASSASASSSSSRWSPACSPCAATARPATSATPPAPPSKTPASSATRAPHRTAVAAAARRTGAARHGAGRPTGCPPRRTGQPVGGVAFDEPGARRIARCRGLPAPARCRRRGRRCSRRSPPPPTSPGYQYVPADRFVTGALVPGTSNAVVAVDGHDLMLLDLDTRRARSSLPAGAGRLRTFSGCPRRARDGRFVAQLARRLRRPGNHRAHRLRGGDRPCRARTADPAVLRRRRRPQRRRLAASPSPADPAATSPSTASLDGQLVGSLPGLEPTPEATSTSRLSRTAALEFGPDGRIYLGLDRRSHPRRRPVDACR